MCKRKRTDIDSTNFEAEPKVGVRHIDVFKLYTRVVEEGGYDLCSDTKAKPLMWRKLAEEFVGKNQYTAAQAFQIKNVYYKNLVAYEIQTHWGKEPPPKEILEEVTARGGNVMDRTLENYTKATAKDVEKGPDDDSSDVSPEQKTPKLETADAPEDPGSASGRTTRGLRQQPSQRVLFQPDLTAGRQTRGTAQGTPGSPSPGMAVNGIMNGYSSNSAATATLASYEPAQSYPLSLKPVVTPANNPSFYQNERKRKAEAIAGPLAKKYRNIMLPGTGFIGPNIYVRAQLALQSGIPDEEQYALHHLVKISHERGDKYRFDQFPGLAEALLKKVLQISSLFYDVEWEVCYDDYNAITDDETLDGLSGTPDVIDKLKNRIPLVTEDHLQDADFVSRLSRIMEAGLILRNMCMHADNAQYLARQPLARDYLAIVLSIEHSSVVELQHYALDTSEQMLQWCDLSSQDPLYQSLLSFLNVEDRGAIVTTLRTLSRIAMHLAGPKRLDDVPPATLRQIQQWLLIEDEELQSACLDFLFQYTSSAGNVEHLLQCVDVNSMARELGRMLLFHAKQKDSHSVSAKIEEPDNQPPAPVARLSRSLVESLLKMDEPERSSEWLRMCFLPDSAAEMTQISLWQAYQSTFGQYHNTHPHLIAGDFIKNVSSTFTGATAQVAGSNKYVIRGIRARKTPVDTGMLPGSKGADKGKDFHQCHWNHTVAVDGARDPMTGYQNAPTTREVECAEWFRVSDDMLKHVLREHLRLSEKPTAAPDSTNADEKPSRPTSAMANGLTNGTAAYTLSRIFDFPAADKSSFRCRWAGCRRTSLEMGDDSISRTALFARHIYSHLPETAPSRSRNNITPTSKPKPASAEFTWLTTLSDEKNDAAGLPLSAALVLRNLAKFMPQTVPSASGGTARKKSEAESDGDGGGPLAKVFDDDVKERLFFAMSHNATIKSYVANVLSNVRKRGAEA